MMNDLHIGYNTIIRLENNDDVDYSFDKKGIVIINKIIDYLDIRDELNYNNNEYLNFVLNKQSMVINILIKRKSRQELSMMLDVNVDTITRWKNNQTIISKENYYKIREML